jgi:hypothetical protein
MSETSHVDAWSAVYRYRPFVVLMAAVLIVVLLPSSRTGRSRDASRVAAAGETSNPAGGGPGEAATTGGEVGGAAATATGPAGPGNGSSAVRRAGTSGSTATGTATSGASAGWPGIGTPEALAGPFCDRATGRLKFGEGSFPYMPPCARPWPKGTVNGGATAPQGVTADAITLSVVSGGSSTDTSTNRGNVEQGTKDIVAMWARTYETYGRQIKVANNDFGASGGIPDDTQQRAMAVQVAGQHPFAALVFGSEYGAMGTLVRELARRGIVTIAYAAWRDYEAFPGYIWEPKLDPNSEVQYCLSADYIKKKLIGKPARWAGEADFKVSTRKFGLVYDQAIDGKQIDKCFANTGVKPDSVVTYTADPSVFAQQAPTIISKLKAAGITTIIGGTDFINQASFTRQATNQQYFPEWLDIGVGGLDLDLLVRLEDTQQTDHYFGFGGLPADAPGYNWRGTPLLDWYFGANSPAWRQQGGSGPNTVIVLDYVQVFMSGIHMAGPNLNPASFRAGMFATPQYGGMACNCVTTWRNAWGPGLLPPDLGANNYVGPSDITEFWWDNKAVGPDYFGLGTAPGLFRYMYKGQRKGWVNSFTPGEPPAFDSANTITNNDVQKQPARDRTPSYPCRTRNPTYSTADAWGPCPSGGG